MMSGGAGVQSGAGAGGLTSGFPPTDGLVRVVLPFQTRSIPPPCPSLSASLLATLRLMVSLRRLAVDGEPVELTEIPPPHPVASFPEIVELVTLTVTPAPVMRMPPPSQQNDGDVVAWLPEIVLLVMF